MPLYPHLPLESVADIFAGLARHGRVLSSQKYGLRMSLIGMKAVSLSGFDWEAVETVGLAPETAIAPYQIAAGDVLLTCRGTEVRLALAPEKAAGMLIDSNIIAIRCGPKLLPPLLAAYFRYRAGREVLERASQSTTRQKNLTLKAVKKITLPVPPLERQRQMVKLLEIAERQYALALAAAAKRLAIAQHLAIQAFLERGD